MKAYTCLKYPFYKLGTLIRDPKTKGFVTIHFGVEGSPGQYVAKSHEEEEAIESNSWFGVYIFPLAADPNAPAHPAPAESEGETGQTATPVVLRSIPGRRHQREIQLQEQASRSRVGPAKAATQMPAKKGTRPRETKRPPATAPKKRTRGGR